MTRSRHRFGGSKPKSIAKCEHGLGRMPKRSKEIQEIRQNRALRQPQTNAQTRQSLRTTILLAAVIPIVRIMSRRKQGVADQELSWFHKYYITIVLSAASAVVAAVAFWWPFNFRKQINIDSKGGRMGMLFWVFGLQVGQSIPRTLSELFGRKLVIIQLVMTSIAWYHISAWWHTREAFLVGCFLSGAFIPAYQCIGYGILSEIFAEGPLKIVVGFYAAVSMLGILISRPSILVAAAHLVALLLTVSDAKLPLENVQHPVLSKVCHLLLKLESCIIIGAILMIVYAR
ncbi:(ZYRO0G16280g) [Zygosaccharomyces parabailii]|nr:(ZYRO0G16280g) [Zygosaccharomyces parabailii]CDH16256.1 uncharacterized protein ZBAI_08044 [Zygosaccharomyces bailii ISA1307]SJM87840.1 uncharacterized protein ZBIST_4029 [Zygosaccharomyces bailii]